MSDQSQGSWPQPNPQIPPYESQVPQQPYGTPQQPYGAPPAPPASNGLSVAALILGILPTAIIGLIVGIIALVKAGKTGAGKAMAWIGIVLSILWTAGWIVFGVAAGHNVAQRLDPGCLSIESQTALATKMQHDTDPAEMQKDIQQLITELKADQAKTKSAKVRTALANFEKDFEDLQTAMQTGNVPPDLVGRLTTDGKAVDTACGR